MKYKNIFISQISILLLLIKLNAQESSKKLIDFINPFKGAGAEDVNSFSGSNFPGATRPVGFIGQYPLGNLPSHHGAYLFNFSGQLWRTQQK